MIQEQGNHWYTVTEEDEGECIPTTFRVRAADTNDVVDARAFLEQRTATLCDRADSGELLEAARAAYQALPVDIWIGVEETPTAEAGAEDVVVDLWSPMHLALMLQHRTALQQLLRFHEEYAIAALEAMTAAVELPASEVPSGLVSLTHSIDELRLPRVRSTTAVNEDGVSSSSQQPQHQQQAPVPVLRLGSNNNLGGSGRPGSPLPFLNFDEFGQAAQQLQQRATPLQSSQEPQAAAALAVPLLECHVRRDLGNAVVLLGHYDASPSLPVRRSQPRSGGGGGGGGSASVHGEDPTGTPRSQPLQPQAAPTVEEEVAAARRNTRINELEQQFLADDGETFCLANILEALKPVLERVAQGLQELQKEKTEKAEKAEKAAMSPIAHFTLQVLQEHCAAFNEFLRRPVLPVAASVLHTVCGGELDTLSRVLAVFHGALTPILLGKKFFQGQCQHQQHHTASNAASPMAHTLSAPNAARSRTSSGMQTPRTHSLSRHKDLAAATTANTTSPHIGATMSSTVSQLQPLQPASEPFWLSCAPQDAQRLAFYALWISSYDQQQQLGERHGAARLRRASTFLLEYYMAVSSFKRIRESNHVPSATVWSGHIILVTRLLSRECSVEELLDIIGEGGYLTALSTTGMPGTFVALLAAGTAAAASVADAAALRLLTRKMELLLVEVPGRASPLRPFLSGRPATHAERFEELWLGQTSCSSPKKFKTRLEMLYFGALELVLIAAEKAWRSTTAAPTTAADTGKEKKKGESAEATRKADAQAALQGYVAMWRGFLGGLRDRPVHRRSVSRGSNNFSFSGSATAAEARLTPRSRLQPDPPSSSSASSSTVGGGGGVSARTPAVSTVPQAPDATGTPLPQPTTASMAGAAAGAAAAAAAAAAGTTTASTALKDAIVETECLAEFTEAVRKVCSNLPTRLQHGREPLPSLYASVYPGGSASSHEAEAAAATGGFAGTPSHADKSLPVSSLDNEFTYVQKCFADDAESESNDTKLKFYGLFKQATVGDINVAKPWLDMVGRAKWDAWNKLKGMSLVDAKRMYVNEYKLMKQMRADEALKKR